MTVKMHPNSGVCAARHPTRAALEDAIARPPSALGRLGRDHFAVMPAWPLAPGRARIVYLNETLIRDIAGPDADLAVARATIADRLLLTLDPADAAPGATPVDVYVDRQSDPTRMSLNNNLGSGRAAYLGDRFNIKGLGKTVLATSADPNHSNGKLDLVSALWEMLCANTLYDNLRTGTSPVLAVVDLHETMQVPWRREWFPRGYLVRIDGCGELYRPTHLFQKNEPVPGPHLLELAANLGRQDAEKFIERVLHGCWSAGNTSLAGHLIDYDTVFAVRGRGPQYSYRSNWLSNFFGLEGLGQKRLLKSIVQHPINCDSTPLGATSAAFDQARRQQLTNRWLDLAGFDSERFVTRFPIDAAPVPDLAHAFQTLAMKIYPNFRATAPWDEGNAALAVYDLSRFFRLYPLARAAGTLSDVALLQLLRNPRGENVKTLDPEMPDAVRKPLQRDHVIGSARQLASLDARAVAFARQYEVLLSAYLAAFPDEVAAVPVRAYVVNEERTYLNCRPGNDVLVALVQHARAGSITPEQFTELLPLIVQAGDRRPRFATFGCCRCDMRLFLDGVTANLVARDGTFRPYLSFLRATARAAEARWSVDIDGTRQICRIESDEGRLGIVGPPLALQLLASGVVNTTYYCNDEPVCLRPIARLDRPPPSV